MTNPTKPKLNQKFHQKITYKNIVVEIHIPYHDIYGDSQPHPDMMDAFITIPDHYTVINDLLDAKVLENLLCLGMGELHKEGIT